MALSWSLMTKTENMVAALYNMALQVICLAFCTMLCHSGGDMPAPGTAVYLCLQDNIRFWLAWHADSRAQQALHHPCNGHAQQGLHSLVIARPCAGTHLAQQQCCAYAWQGWEILLLQATEQVNAKSDCPSSCNASWRGPTTCIEYHWRLSSPLGRARYVRCRSCNWGSS